MLLLEGNHIFACLAISLLHPSFFHPLFLNPSLPPSLRDWETAQMIYGNQAVCSPSSHFSDHYGNIPLSSAHNS